jgi:ADP-heptose:LPS heptosyltransferase
VRLGLAKALDRVAGGLLARAVASVDRAVEAVRPPRPVEAVHHVLVVKFWGLGNWALLRPVVRDLRERRPGARFTLVTLAANAPLVRDLADRVHLVRPDAYRVVAADLLRATRALRADPPDLSLDFEQFARAGALLARAGGARQRLGFSTGDRGRDGLFTARVPFRSDAHVSRSFRDLAEAAGLPAGPYVPGALAPAEAGLCAAREVAGDGPYVVLHPGSGDNFPGRRWSESGFAALGRAAVREGLRVVVSGGASEAALAERVARGVGAGATSAAGRLDVDGLVALVSGAAALASNDTGPVHLASALAVPVLAIYGPNTPRVYGPLSAGSRALWRGLPCSPCLTTSSYRSSRCRLFTCMESIATGEAVAAFVAILRDGRGDRVAPAAGEAGRGGAACAAPRS